MKPRYRVVNKENMDITDPAEYPEQVLYNVARYKFAAGLLSFGDKALDAACGYGFGSYFLSCYCSSVLGIDKNSEITRIAASRYAVSPASRVAFRGNFDLEKDMFPEGFSTIVSFDTIEHLNYPKEFVRKCALALPAGGLFICGSPQKKQRPDSNRFHCSEMYSNEFFSMLENHFTRVLRFSQNEEMIGIFNEERAWGMIGVCFK